jgi:NADPH:quinone reductase-like Zn-dependent oxidoreductase
MLNLGKQDNAPYTDANILIIGGSDPVGQALVELAVKEGANVYATAAKSHRAYVKMMGATWFPNDPKKFYKLKGKMDVVIDTLCLDGYKSSHEALHRNGKLICTINPPKHDSGSFSEQMDRSWSTFKCSWRPNVIFYDVNKSFQDNPRMFKHDLKYLLHKLRHGEIKPKISGRVSLNQVPRAQKLIEKGLPNGTVVVNPWEKFDPTVSMPIERV